MYVIPLAVERNASYQSFAEIVASATKLAVDGGERLA